MIYLLQIYLHARMYEQVSAALNQTLKPPSDMGGFSSMIYFFVPNWLISKKNGCLKCCFLPAITSGLTNSPGHFAVCDQS